MTYNWVTIIFAAIVIGSVLAGAGRGFGRESRFVIWQVVSIATGVVAIAAGWWLSRIISRFVLQQSTANSPKWLGQVLIAWQQHPSVGKWIAFGVCYLFLAGVLRNIVSLFVQLVPAWMPRPLQESRLLGGIVGGLMGVLRSAVIGALIFIALQYLSLPPLAKQAATSTPYKTLSKQIYEPWLKPLVAKALPVLSQGALQPLAKNINMFAVPTGQSGEETGVLLVPKQISNLALQLTKGMTDPKQKAQALYEWEIHHVTYDWKKYDDYVYHGKWDQQTPLQTLETGKGVCADYALLYADLAHAAGLKVQIDEGIAGTGGDYGNHAWNEVYLPSDGQWITVDTTWGSTQDEWFDVPISTFDETHQQQTAIVIDPSTPSK
ncbi:transglutaminase domain-containing protein [Alicyclobacillus fastidiosus]|uniref:Transglutaminase domain-containing protein n=1 Tax=Alicyclobacillus fastidiosus TaxID=392011 RepID=A0ABV5AEG8_9BACL|nr:transglutaminase domain-containing protein [Alicyclobacillus fastidiosus]WEH09859.1 transglutaminase domain-containing protein [Alicyclobacillus fastidiosus]